MMSWIQRLPKKLLVSFFFGILMVFAFAPLSTAPAAVISLAGFFWLLGHAQSQRQALQLGFAFGLGLFAFGTSWVFLSIKLTSESAPVALGVTILFVLALSLYFVVFAWLAWRLRHLSVTVYYLLTLPFLWVMMEWLRLWIFNGFPWLILGYSQIDSALAGYAPVLGVEGLSWLTAITAGLLIWLLKNSFSAPGLVMLVAIWVGGMLLGMVQWTTPLGDKLQVALVQGNWAQKDKWLPQYTLKTLREYQKEINRYWNADLIVLPETALPIVWQDLGDFFSNTQNRAVLEQKDVLVGTVTRQDDGGYFNSVINLRNGDDYHKHHLVPFGEYTPWPWLFSSLAQLLNIPLSDFSHPPVGQPLVLNNGLAAGLSICYEIAFQSQQQAYMPQASLLVTLSNDAWFDRSLEPEQHLQMARMRALELGRPLARATNTGATALIDEKGQLVTRLALRTKATLLGQIQPQQGLTPYGRWGENLMMVLMGLLALLLWRQYAHKAEQAMPDERI